MFHYRSAYLVTALALLLIPSATATVHAELSGFVPPNGGLKATIGIGAHNGVAPIQYSFATNGYNSTLGPSSVVISVIGPGLDRPLSVEFRYPEPRGFSSPTNGAPLAHTVDPIFLTITATGPQQTFIGFDLPDGSPCPVMLTNSGQLFGIFTCTDAALSISTPSLQDAAIQLDGTSQTQSVIATGGKPPYTWTLRAAADQIPAGFLFIRDGSNLSVQISNEHSNPLRFGSYNIGIQVSDSTGQTTPTKLFVYKVVCGVDPNNDTDQDGLKDCWELGGIDVDGDGTADLVLGSGPGILQTSLADPLRKDVFVEVDWMENHRPLRAGLLSVINAFNDAPIKENGKGGIRLHIEVDEQALSHSQGIWFNTLDACKGQPDSSPGSPYFRDVKSSFFGTAQERTNPLTIQAKLKAFRYAIFAHQFNEGSQLFPLLSLSSGKACTPGADFVVTLV